MHVKLEPYIEYRLYHVATKQILMSRDIIFMETQVSPGFLMGAKCAKSETPCNSPTDCGLWRV